MNGILDTLDRISDIQKKFASMASHTRRVGASAPTDKVELTNGIQGSSATTGNGSFGEMLKEQIDKDHQIIDKVDFQGLSSKGYSKYKDEITKASEAYKLPVSLIDAVIQQESAYNTGAVSPKGAMGLMQLMPSTAQELGVSDPFSPEENIMGGTKYLRGLLNNYDGDLAKSLAAYNAGPAALKNGEIPNYPETKDYVRKVVEKYLQNLKL